MGIFGQVWLWSSLAFLLGAVLCWLLVALPARRRVLELEADVATRARRQPERELRRRPADDREDELNRQYARSSGMVPGLSDDPDEAEGSDSLVRSIGGSRRAAEPYEVPMNRGRFDQPPPPDAFAPEQSEPLFAGPPSDSDFGGDFGGGLIAPPETDPEVASPSASATQYIPAASMNLPTPPQQPSSQLEAPPEVPAQAQTELLPLSDRGWFDDELRGELAEQPPEEQPATVRREPVAPAATTTNLPIQEPSPILSRLVDDDPDADAERSAIEDDSGGTVFTQRTRPIPGELIRQIDDAGPGPLVDDMADDGDDEAARVDQTEENEPVSGRHGASNGLVEQATEVTSAAETAQEQTVVAPGVLSATADESSPREPAVEPKMPPGVTVSAEPSKLPKRVPSKPQSRAPFGVMPALEPTRTGSRAAPAAAAATASESTRSLFEPIVPANDGTPVPPPPNKLRDGNGTTGASVSGGASAGGSGSGGGRGPFGPGSAMPLPGGASPSPEFTIKASVAALRYCTPESPQFGRTVAEVWFRTAADAERVGFRPVG